MPSIPGLQPLLITAADLRELGATLAGGRAAAGGPGEPDDEIPTLRLKHAGPDPEDVAIDAMELADFREGRTAARGGRLSVPTRGPVGRAPAAPAKAALPPLPSEAPPARPETALAEPEPPPPPPEDDASGAADTQARAEESDDDLGDFVSEMVRDNQVSDARRRATTRSRRPWHEELFDAAWLTTVPERPERVVRREAQLYASLLGLRPGSRVLDLACGDGAHCVALAEAGFAPTGLDFSPDMLAAAERRAREAEVEVEFVEGDMRAPEFDDHGFDGVLCVGTSFGYFDDAANLDTLRQAVRLAVPGGAVLVDALNRDHVMARLPARELRQIGAILVVEEVSFAPASSRLEILRQVVYGDGEVRDWAIDLRVYAPHELANLMRALGLANVQVSGEPAFAGRFLGSENGRVVVSGRRPAASPTG